MSILTTFFNLIKPAKTDGVKVADFNDNMDIIDEEMHKPPLTVNGTAPDSTTRNLTLTEVPLAGNLSSDIAQINQGTFIERTSGGSTSISDGAAFLTSVNGSIVHTGQVPESLEMTVNATGEENPITATIDRDTFVSYVSTSGTITLSYTSAWSADPALYGVTVSGTPADGDSIVIVYVKENRGTITTATPSAFNSTGWNLYNNADGVKYARVVKYSDEYGYKIGGNYSLVYFSTTVSGEQSAVTISDGYFNIPSDGFVHVSGGDATTYIYPTWTDWTDDYQGDFQTYTVSTIDLSAIVGVLFTNGMAGIGLVADEINLNTQQVIQRIGRLAYSAENLETVIASGADYDADTNYIYYVLAEPVLLGTLSLDGEYTVSDHGIEFFDGTTVPLDTEVLYGENLKDKLRTDVLTISAQTLTAPQKLQVQTNLDVPSNANAVHKSGDEDISGKKSFLNNIIERVAARRKYFTFQHNTGTNGICGQIVFDAGNDTNQTVNQMYFVQFSPTTTASASNTGYYEQFYLPVPTKDRTFNATYNILTTKSDIGSIYQASSTTHTITVPNGTRNLITILGDGIQTFWFGAIYCSTAGTVTFIEIAKGANVTESHTTNSMTFTFGSASSAYITAFNIRRGGAGLVEQP